MKRIMLIFMSLIMIFSFAACNKGAGDKKAEDNNSGNNSGDISAVTVTPAEIEQKIAAAVGSENYLCDTEIDKDWLQNSFGLDLSKVESYSAKQNSISSVNPDTVIVLKTKDGYANEAAEILNTSFEQMVGYIRQYPFGTAKVLNARLYQSGNYVIYVIAGASYDGDDAEAEAKLAVAEYEKIDEVIEGIFGALPENLAVVLEDDGSAGGLTVPDDDTPVLGG